MSKEENADSKGGNFLSRELVGNIPWALGSKLVLFIVSLLATRVIFRGLDDKDAFGIYRLCSLTAEYLLIVCSLGLNIAVMRFVPELQVKGSKPGLIRLLLRSTYAQAASVIPIALLLYLAKPYLDEFLFGRETNFLLFIVVIVLVGRLGRTFAETVLTSLFRMQAVSIMSLIYGVLWLGATAVVLKYYPTPSAALITQSVVLFAVASVGTFLVFRVIRGLDWQGSSEGIGLRRVLGISVPRQMTQISSLITQRYSEVFFLGFFFSPAVAGIYELGNWLPFALITFLPQSLQGLFTAGFAEAYSRDPKCLGRLVTTYYKVLILLVMPISAFGTFFATDALRVLIDDNVQEAGPIASAFFILHAMPLLSAPLALAIVTREKSMQMQPLLIMMIVANLFFDWMLIPRYGMVGACLAILATFLCTIPFRLYVTSKLVGGVNFPMAFFLKIVAVLFGLAYVFSLLVDAPGFFALSGLVVVYLVVYGGMLRGLRLLRHEDVVELREMGFSKLNRILNVFVAPEKNVSQ